MRFVDSPRPTTPTTDRARWEPLAFACGAFHAMRHATTLAQIAGDGGCARSLADLTDGGERNAYCQHGGHQSEEKFAALIYFK